MRALFVTVCSHDRECANTLGSLIRVLIHQASPTLFMSSKPNCLRKATFPNTITLEIKASIYEFERRGTIHSIAGFL